VHDPNGTPIALRAYTGQVHYYAQDGLGSAVALINQGGTVTGEYDYYSYGQVTVTRPQSWSNIVAYNPYQFAGGLADATSTLMHYGMRWYDPLTGRWTQQDSLETPRRPQPRQPLRVRRQQPDQLR
jgi:RHS repeat-associated protein